MYAVQDKSEVNIERYLEVLRRRWLWIALVPLVLVALSLVRDFSTAPVYRASTQLLLQAKTSENIFSPTAAPSDPARALQNELRVVNSRTVKRAVEKKYGEPVAITAAAGGEDDIIVLSGTARTGAKAARRVNVYASTYQAVRLDALLQDITTAKKAIQQQIDDFQKQINQIDAPLATLDQQILGTPPDDPRYGVLVNSRESLKERTDAQRTAAQDALNDYQQRLQILQVSERLSTSGGVQILNPAVVPSSPISPTPVKNAVEALILGLFIGLGLAFARDQLDDSLRKKVDVERALKDIPTLGLVPFDSALRDSRSHQLVTLTAPMSTTAEAYRGLRTAIQFAGIDNPKNIIQVTSTGAAEGKTTMLSNLAVAFAQTGKRVVVVGCDLRKPRLQQMFEVDGSIGFTSVVLGDVSLEEGIQASPLHPNIDVLASGPRPPNPSELLSIDRSTNIIRMLAEQYSMVFIDCPPVLPVTDALVISRCVDATIFVVAANRTNRRSAQRAVEMLRQVETPLLGSVINGVAAEDGYGSLYEYYGYGGHSHLPLIGRFIRRRGVDVPATSENVLPQDRQHRADDTATSEPEPDHVWGEPAAPDRDLHAR